MPSKTLLVSVAGLLTSGVLGQPANPISVSGVVNYGELKSTNDGIIFRDGGPEGSIGGTYLNTWSDTSKCTSDNSDTCTITAANVVTLSTYVPYEVTDFGSSGKPSTFCSSGGSSSRLHISAIVPLTSTTGAVWYKNLSQSSSPCGNANGCVLSNGVAQINYQSSTPTCSPLFPLWDPSSEPLWGGPVGPLADNYIYMTGQLDSSAPSANLSDVYLARVQNGSTFDYSKYQYWNGTAFQSSRLHNPVVTLPGGGAYDRPSILQNVGTLGSFTYNKYYNKYFILAVANHNQVVAYTSTLPQGPWSAGTAIYTNLSYSADVPLYAPNAQTRFDLSGKSLVITACDFGRNNVDVVAKVTFN